MGTTTPASNMATQQMFLALCVVGVAVAAPQLTLGLGRSSSSSSEQEVVSNVITALGPEISKAVEEALASINANAENEAAEAARLEEQRQQQILIQQQKERRAQQIAAANAAAAAAALEEASFEAELSNDLGPVARPVYKFQYKVADEEAQTYISKEEERDGDELSGTYSFVDATGSLVTVNYRAGAMGYTEERSSEPGFVQMRAIPAWTGALAGVDDVEAGSSAARGSSSSSGSSFGSSFGSSSGSISSSSASSSVDQDALIARIIAALSPQITEAVNAAIN